MKSRGCASQAGGEGGGGDDGYAYADTVWAWGVGMGRGDEAWGVGVGMGMRMRGRRRIGTERVEPIFKERERAGAARREKGSIAAHIPARPRNPGMRRHHTQALR